MRLAKIIGGAAFLVIGAGLEALNNWHLLDFVLIKLRDSSAFGSLVAKTVESPIAGLVLVLTGLGIVVAGVRENRKESGSLSPTTSSSVSVTNQPNISPSISQNVYVGTSHPLPSPVETPEDSPTLQLVQLEGKRLARSFRYIWVEIPSGGQAGLVAVFRNEPKRVGHRTPTASGVTAHLKFMHSTEEEAIELYVDHGTWLGEYTHFRTLRPAETCSLIISVQDNQQLFALDNPNQIDPLRSRSRSGSSIHFIPPTPKVIPYRTGIVEITLVSKALTVFSGRFSYVLEDGESWTMSPINL